MVPSDLLYIPLNCLGICLKLKLYIAQLPGLCKAPVFSCLNIDLASQLLRPASQPPPPFLWVPFYKFTPQRRVSKRETKPYNHPLKKVLAILFQSIFITSWDRLVDNFGINEVLVQEHPLTIAKLLKYLVFSRLKSVIWTTPILPQRI